MQGNQQYLKPSLGFTLIELMVTVAIIAILASIALPAYTDYIRRGKLPEAFTYLADYRVKMEQYYQDHNNYGAAACADAINPATWNTFSPAGTKYFSFSCALGGTSGSVDAQTYTLTATGSVLSSNDHVYTIKSDGTKATTTLKGASLTSCRVWASKASEC